MIKHYKNLPIIRYKIGQIVHVADWGASGQITGIQVMASNVVFYWVEAIEPRFERAHMSGLFVASRLSTDEKLNNYDKIRSMTFAEMAKYFTDGCPHEWTCLDGAGEWCKNCWKNWLKKEADGCTFAHFAEAKK